MPELPPAFLMLAAALVMALTRGVLQQAVAVAAPLLCLALIWSLPEQASFTLSFLTAEPLQLLQQNRPSLIFSTIFCLIATAGAIYAWGQKRRVELPAAFLFAGSAIGICFAGDLLSLFIYWELMAVGAAVVVASGGQRHSLAAAQRYICVHLVGGVLLLMGIILYSQQFGLALPADPLAAGNHLVAHLSALSTPEAWLMLIGILVNVGAPGLGAWLPDAYPEGSPSGTVFLSAFTTKTAVLVLLMCFTGTSLLLWVGSAMAIIGILYAIRADDMRQVLAWTIINQVGFMLVGVGIGSELALAGVGAHAFAHIIYKGLLFMATGAVLYQTGERCLSRLGGLAKSMPLACGAAIIGALAMGVPGTVGFTTKTMITTACTEVGAFWPWLILEIATVGVFLTAGIKVPWMIFFAPSTAARQAAPALRPLPLGMGLAMLVLVLPAFLFGWWTTPLYQALPYTPIAHSGDGEATAFSVFKYGKILSQLQLVGFSLLAFMLLHGFLCHRLGPTWASDIVYRRWIPSLWQRVLLPPMRRLGELQEAVMRGLPRWARQSLVSTDAGERARLSSDWPIGAVVILLCAMLCFYLLIHFNAFSS